MNLYQLASIYGPVNKVTVEGPTTQFFFATQLSTPVTVMGITVNYVGVDTNWRLVISPTLVGPWATIPNNQMAGANEFSMVQQLNDGTFIGLKGGVGMVTASVLTGPWKPVQFTAPIDQYGNNIQGGPSFLAAV
jgi:hypothetical protein